MSERRALRAGPLRCVVEAGALRWVTLRLPGGGEQEVVRGVYAAVRDHNWGTPPPRFTRYDVVGREDSFSVQFTAEHVAGDINLLWDGTIDGRADGTISFSMDATARSTFLTNRLGFCVLHPMEAAGTPVEVEHTDGSVERGKFPVEISPHQPFFDIAALRQEIGGVRVETRFEGDVFEMEDQRNWTDASYKTYCTPLALPYPVAVAAGRRIEQRVVVSATQRAVPPIGLQAASHGDDLSHWDVERLRALRPAHLWVTLDLTRAEWEERFRRAARQAGALGCPLEIEAVCGERGAGIDALAARLAVDGTPVSAVHVYPESGVVTTEPVLTRARQAFAAAQLRTAIGGGSRADFVNVNRAELPIEQMDFLAFAVNPQVHAFDDDSVLETLRAQGVVLENAKRIARGKPVRVGPITLRQRINPAATAVKSAPAPDPRQRTQFCADWTAASVRALTGADALTYYETTGPFGVLDGGEVFPVYEVLRAVAAERN